jgi:hypothetical protein
MVFRVVLRVVSFKGVVIIALACRFLCVPVSAQISLQTTVPDSLYNISYAGASLDAVLADLAEVSGIDLVYNPGLTQGKRITIEMTEGTSEQILAAVVHQARLQFRRLDTGTYVISRLPAEPPPPPPPAVLQGSVSDSDTGKPVGNVRMISAGRLPVVLTDSAGYFRYTGVPEGRHLLVAVKDGYSIAFSRVEAVSGETTDVFVLLHPDSVHVEMPDTAVITNGPVYHSVITGMYNQDSVVFPEWNGTGHGAWLATLPGIIALKPVTGYHALSFWSTDNAGSAQGLFLFTGRIPDYSIKPQSSAHPLKTIGRDSNGPGNRWAPGFTKENRPHLSAEIELSDTFLEGGISSGHLPLQRGVLTAGASLRMINPVIAGNIRMIDDLTRWLYSDPNTGLNVPGRAGQLVNMDAGLMESGFILEYAGSERLTAGLSVNSGISNLDVNGTGGSYLLYFLSDSFKSRYTEVSQFIRYDAGAQGVFWQTLHSGHSRFIHQQYANIIAQRYYGRYSRNELGFEAGYSHALSERTGLQTRYNFDSGTYKADFVSDWFHAHTGDKNRATDHRFNVDVIFRVASGHLAVRPGLAILMSTLAGSPVFDPGIALVYTYPGYPGRGVHIQAGWHQQSDYRHRFRMPVPVGSAPVPFYDIMLASGDGAEPVVVNYRYFDAAYSLNEMAKFRIFARYGVRKKSRRPDFTGSLTGLPDLMSDGTYLTDFREFRIGGVIYGYSARAGLESALSYSYGHNTGISDDRFDGKRVQAAGHMPHHVMISTQWSIGRDLKVEMLWESRFGNMERALHEKYYQYSQLAGAVFTDGKAPAPGEHQLESWHRLDAGMVTEHYLAGVNFTIKVQLMNILNRKNHMDTVMIPDPGSPEPRFTFHKRTMPGFYPQFSLKAGF